MCAKANKKLNLISQRIMYPIISETVMRIIMKIEWAVFDANKRVELFC